MRASLQSEIEELNEHMETEQDSNQKMMKRMRETHEQELDDLHAEIDDHKIKIRELEKVYKGTTETLEKQLQEKKLAGDNLSETKEKLLADLNCITQVPNHDTLYLLL